VLLSRLFHLKSQGMEDAEGALQWQPNFSLKSTLGTQAEASKRVRLGNLTYAFTYCEIEYPVLKTRSKNFWGRYSPNSVSTLVVLTVLVGVKAGVRSGNAL